MNLSESLKPRLIIQTRNSLNLIFELNEEIQFTTNFILKDEIGKKIKFKILSKLKNSNQKNKD